MNFAYAMYRDEMKKVGLNLITILKLRSLTNEVLIGTIDEPILG